MKHVITFFALFLVTGSVWSQVAETDSTVVVQPYALTEISSRLQETEDLISKAQQYAEDRSVLDRVQADFLETDSLLQVTMSKIDTTSNSLVELRSIQSELTLVSSQLEGFESTLNGRTEGLDKHQQDLKDQQNIWKVTLDKLKEDNSSQTVVANVEKEITAINTMLETLVDQVDEVFQYQNELSERKSRIAKSAEMLRKAESGLSGQIFKVDALPIWAASTDSVSFSDFGQQISSNFNARYDNVKSYVERNMQLFIINGIIIVILLVILMVLRAKQEKLSKIHDHEALWVMFKYPVGLAILLGTLVFTPPYEFFPEELADVLLFFVYTIVLFIVYRLVRKSSKPFLLFLAIFLLANTVLSYSNEYKIYSRMLFFVEAFLGIYFIYAFMKPGIKSYDFYKTPVAGWMIRLIPFGFLTFGVSIIANVLGATNFTEYILFGTVKSIAFGVLIFAVGLVLNGILIIVLRSPRTKMVYVVQENAEYLEKKTNQWLQVGMFLYFLVTICREFEVWDDVKEYVAAFLNFDLSVGTIEFTLNAVLAFVLTILVSWWIAKLTRVILEKEIFRRMDLPRGIPKAISVSVFYVILTLGFFIALTQSGFELSQISIIVGALSVGIGFGLQNIISNFVSGIILAFERPVQEGDVVEIGTMWGTVKSIGIRSSKVRTYDGSEVIMPNNNLVSNEVTNWTLSDRKRRMTIEVGVAYGTNPRKVAEILKQVAEDYPKTLKDPSPLVVFKGFGDSSLNFKLHFWTTFDDGYVGHSEVSMNIYDAFETAGIEIPFPQRVVTMAEKKTRKAAWAGKSTPSGKESDEEKPGPES